MDEKFEKKLIEAIEPVYQKARSGDWDHARRVVKLCRHLLAHEKADEDIVLMTAYLHDIGWSATDFSDFNKATPRSKTKSQSFFQHMEKGAVIAGEILTDMGIDRQVIKEIQSIIASHDLPEKIFQMDNINGTLIVEADRLDRYGKAGLERFETMFGADKLQGSYWEEAKKLRLDGLKEWFKTRTARDLSQKLAKEMGLFE